MCLKFRRMAKTDRMKIIINCGQLLVTNFLSNLLDLDSFRIRYLSDRATIIKNIVERKEKLV